MNREDFVEALADNCDEDLQTVQKKNNDYAQGDDPFQNFRMVEDAGLTSVETCRISFNVCLTCCRRVSLRMLMTKVWRIRCLTCVITLIFYRFTWRRSASEEFQEV